MIKKEIIPGDETFILSQNVPFQFTEAFKTMRTNLQYAGVDSPLKKIIVTSALPGEGKTTVAINLALTMSQLMHKVIIVDTDLRKPKVQKYLSIKNSKKTGLTLALTGQHSTMDNVAYVDRLGIYVMPAGPVVPNPAELLQSKMMHALTDELEENFNFIIFDTPPVSIVSDAAVLSSLTDGVIFVIRQNYASLDAVLNAKNNLENVKAHIIGCVLNAYNAEKSNHYNSYYYQSSENGY